MLLGRVRALRLRGLGKRLVGFVQQVVHLAVHVVAVPRGQGNAATSGAQPLQPFGAQSSNLRPHGRHDIRGAFVGFFDTANAGMHDQMVHQDLEDRRQGDGQKCPGDPEQAAKGENGQDDHDRAHADRVPHQPRHQDVVLGHLNHDRIHHDQ